MPSLRDIFDHPRPGTEGQRTAEQWPPIPPFVAIPAGRSELPAYRDLSAGSQRDPNKYGPGIVIGLGKSGEIALRTWLTKLAQNPAGPQDSLRAILVSHQPDPAFPTSIVDTRVLDLSANSGYAAPAAYPASYSASQRMECHGQFQSVANSSKFQNWVRDALKNIQGQVQVYVVGSLGEAEIGCIGDVLQILRTVAEGLGRGNPYANINALLSMEAAGGQLLSQAESYAAIREIGRFTFSGPHVMDAAVGPKPVLRMALLDNIFLIELSHLAIRAATPEQLYEQGAAQTLAEALLAFLHTTAYSMWGELAGALRSDASDMRSRYHKVVAHAFGIASLYAPLTEIENYIAARLAYAVLFGERKDEISEGLVVRHPARADLDGEAKLQGQRWLRNKSHFHPIFEFLLNATGPANFFTLPEVSPEFASLFQFQISHSLVGFLNDPAGSDLELAQATLRYLVGYFETLDRWFKGARTQNPNSETRLAFQSFLLKCREALQQLLTSLTAWQAALAVSGGGSLARLNAEAAGSKSDYRERLFSNGSSNAAASSPAAAVASLAELLQKGRQSAETELNAQAASRICRPVTADESGGLREVESYYTESIRPELKQYYAKDSTSAFSRLRERLEWWIGLVPGYQPQLLLICWPASYQVSATTNPPKEACFGPADADRLVETLLQIGRSLMYGRAKDLTGTWFGKRVGQMAEFLRTGSDAYLDIDLNSAARQLNAAARRSYLFGKDQIFCSEYKSRIFPDSPADELTLLGGWEESRLTALTFRLNIPLDAIRSVANLYPEYQSRASDPLHLYIQESTAADYERRIWKSEHERLLIPSELAVTFPDPGLVSVFCQALIAGLVHVRTDKHRQTNQWVVASVGNDFPVLELAPDTEHGLWKAYRRFVIELPFDPEVNLNPQNHFHNQRRSAYLAQLIGAVKKKKNETGFKVIRDRFRKGLLAEWDEKCREDELYKSFGWLLRAEAEEPAWQGWDESA